MNVEHHEISKRTWQFFWKILNPSLQKNSSHFIKKHQKRKQCLVIEYLVIDYVCSRLLKTSQYNISTADYIYLLKYFVFRFSPITIRTPLIFEPLIFLHTLFAHLLLLFIFAHSHYANFYAGSAKIQVVRILMGMRYFLYLTTDCSFFSFV